MSYPAPNEIYRAAVVAERKAWDVVRGKLPGSPDFDEVQWQAWRGAMTVVVQALDGMRSRQKADDWRLRPVAPLKVLSPLPSRIRAPAASTG